MTALLALPLSGGALTFTLRVSSNQPAIQSLDEEGMIFICSFIYSCCKSNFLLSHRDGASFHHHEQLHI